MTTPAPSWSLERKGIEVVSEAERQGRVGSVFTLWVGANVEFATLTTGALATGLFGLSFWQALLALGIGNLLGAVLMGVLSSYGPRIGLPQLMQSRRAFGSWGNRLPALLNFIGGFSWFAVNTVLGAFALDWLFGFPFALSVAILTLAQGFIAVIGHNLIHAIERYLAWILVAIFLVVSVYGFSHTDFALPAQLKALSSFGGLSGAFILTIAVTFSYLLGWMPYASDYTRYLPSSARSAQVFSLTFWSNFLACLWIEVLGAALATIAPLSVPTDLVTHLLPHLLGVLAMLAVILGTVTANVLNIYSGALSSLALGLRLPRWGAAVVVSCFGLLISLLAGQNYYGNYESFLFLLGYWTAPWVAVVILHLYFSRSSSAGEPSRFRWGFWAWLIGIALSVPFMNQSLYTGPFAASHPGFGDLTYFVSFLVAALVYWFGLRRSAALSASAS